ncbi:alpha/beta-hydrolase, partial [Conidiobolus coronatus NRRL 28638]
FLSYAGAAYCSANSLYYWTCNNCQGYSRGTSNVVYLSSTLTDSSGYLAVNNYNRQIIIAFKGTSSIFNWLYNAVIITNNAGVGDPYSSAAVHGGFNTMANYLYQQTQIALINAMRQFPNYQVVFTGHSLGGAIAEILAFKLAQNGVIRYENINIYTYGQPKAGNSAFASYVNSQPWTYMRVTSFGDPVPTLPPSILGFAQNEYNTFINPNGQTIPCTS